MICESCSPIFGFDIDQDNCDCIDGRFIEAVNEYTSTCDLCGELTSHELMEMDLETQLGYCSKCVPRAIELGILVATAITI